MFTWIIGLLVFVYTLAKMPTIVWKIGWFIFSTLLIMTITCYTAYKVDTRIINPEKGAEIDREFAKNSPNTPEHKANYRAWESKCTEYDKLALTSKELSDEIQILKSNKYVVEFNIQYHPEEVPDIAKARQEITVIQNRIDILEKRLAPVDAQLKQAFLEKQRLQASPG